MYPTKGVPSGWTREEMHAITPPSVSYVSTKFLQILTFTSWQVQMCQLNTRQNPEALNHNTITCENILFTCCKAQTIVKTAIFIFLHVIDCCYVHPVKTGLEACKKLTIQLSLFHTRPQLFTPVAAEFHHESIFLRHSTGSSTNVAAHFGGSRQLFIKPM